MKLIDDMAQLNLQPLWQVYYGLVTPEPAAADHAEHWPWAKVSALVDRTIADVDMAEAERRVMLFSNPDLAPDVWTTANLQAGLQVLAAGENAEPHRHTAAAIRFVIAGGNAATTVDGCSCAMETGDLILTPAWTWHGHYNSGDHAVLWLDILDVPLARRLDQVFFEPRPPTPIAPTDGAEQYRYPWADMVRSLQSGAPAADGVVRVQYEDRETGGAVMPTLDCQAWELRTGSLPMRSTASAICLVVEGEGESRIGEHSLAWRQNDVFTIPLWTWAEHQPTSACARLFVVTDGEMLRRLALLREEVGTR